MPPFPGQSQQTSTNKGGMKQKLLKVASFFSKKDDSNKFFIAVDDYAGDLYFREKETGTFYKVKALGVYEPKLAKGATKELPKNLCFNILVNLTNPKAVEKVEG